MTGAVPWRRPGAASAGAQSASAATSLAQR